MALFHDSAIAGASGNQATGYKIERSLRFNSSDSAYLSRAFSVTGDRQKWTFSTWIKKTGNSYSIAGLFCAGTGSNSSYDGIVIGANNTDTLAVGFANSAGNANDGLVETTQVFRDPSSWYHIVVAADTTQATASNRLRFYVNGAEVTTFSSTSYPSQNYQFNFFNTATTHAIGCGAGSFLAARFFSGYYADTQFIGGQALDPTSFAETNITTGQWVPKAYTSTYGTNGFRLAFADNSNNTATTLGKDSSPNGNNWTPNNLSVTAGAGNDSLVDTPTSYGTDTGAGGEVRGNYATLNPLTTNSVYILANGNLDITDSGDSAPVALGTVAVNSGKWYWEVALGNGFAYVGAAQVSSRASAVFLGQFAGQFIYNPSAPGSSYVNGVAYNYSTASTAATGDVIGVALDFDSNAITYYKNGVSQGAFSSGVLGNSTWVPAFKSNVATSATFNFGQRPFAYAAPSGFKALCDTNLPAPVVAKPNTLMDVLLWTGNATARTITGLNYSPDFVWIKGRSQAPTNHFLYDAIRGATNRICSSLTIAEASEPNTLTSFNADGFSLGTDAGVGACNQSGQTYVAWCWDAGSSTVTNTQGSITSQVRANASAGFSIVTYSQGATNGTIGHGLGIAPAFIIAKSRTVSGTNWPCYHISLGKDLPLQLSTTSAQISASNYWGTTAPSATTFGVGTAGSQDNNNGDMVAYCFAPVAGYSSFGSYTGNGSADGPFVFTGMRPRWILIKSTSATGDWSIVDTARDAYNLSNKTLYPNLSAAEETPYGPQLDILSNGFKFRSGPANQNNSGTAFIYAAFAENPFQYARAR